MIQEKSVFLHIPNHSEPHILSIFKNIAIDGLNNKFCSRLQKQSIGKLNY